MELNERLVKWLLSGDTGTSSKAIVSQMTGIEAEDSFSDYPRDTSDFGRCYRLMKAVPEFRFRISEMASRSERWAALVACWDELDRLYETDKDACYKKIKEVLATAKDEHVFELGNGMSFSF
ncbi:hypothetical protein [Marinomonas ostreistagni]|uniref:Uncharacterized protein n=1 Tax=Marinomonas ostreistagni TaxID=359209 RepID=A0ABS0ZAT0_9GAMM|nr:hypothetical protein [Marinomonas ostreistagni]MBJ7550765.1 hypothetical protein [Marinomonas ostreistagni]